MSSNERKAIAESEVAKLLREASGFDLGDLDYQASFPELGFDSLFLVQFGQKIKSQLKVRVTFRQLIEEIGTVGMLIDYLAVNLPDDMLAVSSNSPPREPTTDSDTTPASAPVSSASDAPMPDAMSVSTSSTVVPPAQQPVALARPTSLQSLPDVQFQQPSVSMPSSENTNKSALAQIIAQQNQLMSMQLQLLTGSRPTAPVTDTQLSQVAATTSGVTPSPQFTTESTIAATANSNGERASAAASQENRVTESKSSFERFGPFKPVRKAQGGGLTDVQQEYLDRLIKRFTKRTAKSRDHAQTHREYFADPRGVAGYRRIWKSMVYQIAVERSKGSKLWDLDGNEYIDIAMGFGLNLFGQSPDFINDAIAEQLKHGVEVGPQSPLAGDVAQLLCDLSRKDRATFCNTGSEAVMAAMRLARTVSGKSKIVFFNKDYHGNFDQVLIRSSRIANQRRSQPAAPGVPQPFADVAIVLDYGTEEALATLRARADEIAAVLVEPVQSADPFIQPKEFLQSVRQITKEHGIAMIMDEVITGFRAAPGGAQEWFDVWGDMATYGKILGGGLPIGALAGSAEYMDALDGGNWKYEGDSEPTADMTFFAGTFVRHPLAMAAAHQVLMRIKDSGPELQQALTDKTTYLVNSLNAFFEQEVFPIRVAQFTSLFRFMFPSTVEYADLLYFHLLDRGIFTRGWGDNCFLSTAHSDDDIERIISAVKDSCQEIRAGGFMPKCDDATAGEPVDNSGKRVQRDDACAITPAPLSVTRTTSTPRMSTLEEIREEGALPPLFCMPAADGLTLVFHELASRLGDDQPVYGLNSPGAYGEPVPDTIEEMAERFIEDMREVRPHGPYALIGYCSGGTIAFEVAQQLKAAGEEVSFLAGIETYDWATAQSSQQTLWIKFYYHVQRIDFHFRNFLLLDFQNKTAFLSSKWDRLKNRIRIWRGKVADLFTGGKPKSRNSGINWNQVWKAHDAQADRYMKRPYPGTLLLIRPRKDYRSYVGKEDLEATEGVTVKRIPAYPAGLMTPPYVDLVAELVRDTIRESLEGSKIQAMREVTQKEATTKAAVLTRRGVPNPAGT